MQMSSHGFGALWCPMELQAWTFRHSAHGLALAAAHSLLLTRMASVVLTQANQRCCPTYWRCLLTRRLASHCLVE